MRKQQNKALSDALFGEFKQFKMDVDEKKVNELKCERGVKRKIPTTRDDSTKLVMIVEEDFDKKDGDSYIYSKSNQRSTMNNCSSRVTVPSKGESPTDFVTTLSEIDMTFKEAKGQSSLVPSKLTDKPTGHSIAAVYMKDKDVMMLNEDLQCDPDENVHIGPIYTNLKSNEEVCSKCGLVFFEKGHNVEETTGGDKMDATLAIATETSAKVIRNCHKKEVLEARRGMVRSLSSALNAPIACPGKSSSRALSESKMIMPDSQKSVSEIEHFANIDTPEMEKMLTVGKRRYKRKLENKDMTEEEHKALSVHLREDDEAIRFEDVIKEELTERERKKRWVTHKNGLTYDDAKMMRDADQSITFAEDVICDDGRKRRKRWVGVPIKVEAEKVEKEESESEEEVVDEDDDEEEKKPDEFNMYEKKVEVKRDTTNGRHWHVSHTGKGAWKEANSSKYDPLGYFLESLEHREGRDALLPQEMVDRIEGEFTRRGIPIHPFTKAKDFVVIMKSLGFNRHYYSIPQIRARITKVPPPQIPKEEVHLLIYQFMCIVHRWPLMRINRSSLPRQNVIFDLLCTMNETPNYVQHGPVLASSAKLQDIHRDIFQPAIANGLIPNRERYNQAITNKEIEPYDPEVGLKVIFLVPI